MSKFDKEEKQILKNNLENMSKVNGKYKNWSYWLNDKEIDVIAELQTCLMLGRYSEEDNAYSNWPTSSVLQLLSDMINQCLPGEDASKSCRIELILFGYVASFKRDLDDDEMVWVSDTAREILENKEPDIDKIVDDIEGLLSKSDKGVLKGDFAGFGLFC